MSDQYDIWIEDKPHSVEGHIFYGTLTFKGKVVWGPKHCHNNTTQLKTALRQADDRLDMEFISKPNSVEGHTRYISVKSKGNVILNKLSTHDNMDELVTVVKTIWNIDSPA
ncbi:uncharacterized protein BDW43DRAFT_303430 [Aspergillus alliaceus]|uniref:uncharacterized protein n=1 Tax=Petromyces alliaceus TaxID=209559 RepID=UPI0012A3C9BA|nr:uncharacterized protein BDW43DRAFT_303430 [Aspergillus alliaceus]KAB8228987.1 hypothetical protein BDW43DRAFT_303430 [Aspergillus alliaceus]